MRAYERSSGLVVGFSDPFAGAGMRKHVAWWVAVLTAAVTASAFAQVSKDAFFSEDCTGDRGFVRTGKITAAPANPAVAKVITIQAFNKITYPNASNSA